MPSRFVFALPEWGVSEIRCVVATALWLPGILRHFNAAQWGDCAAGLFASRSPQFSAPLATAGEDQSLAGTPRVVMRDWLSPQPTLN